MSGHLVEMVGNKAIIYTERFTSFAAPGMRQKRFALVTHVIANKREIKKQDKNGNLEVKKTWYEIETSTSKGIEHARKLAGELA
jgi:hypothetical protein